MAEVEKVKQGVKACWSFYFHHLCLDCPYKPDRDDQTCVERLGADVLELLNAMPPRLLTLEEVKERDCGWAEDKEEDKLVHIVYEIRNSCIAGESIDGFDAQGHYIGWMCNMYGKHRRLWSDKPTEEQRKATPWDK